MRLLLLLLSSLVSLSVFSGVTDHSKERPRAAQAYYLTGTQLNKTGLDISRNVPSRSADFKGKFPKNAVIEEATGTWCGYCPRGIVMCDYIRERYSDRIFTIAAHQDDKMESEEYAEFFSSYVSSFPSAFVNRTEEMNIGKEGADDLYDKIKDQLTYAKVDLTARLENNQLYIESETEFSEDIDSEHRLAFAVVEDGVGPYFQTNYYTGADLGLGVWETEGNRVLCHFDDVARHIKNFKGIKGSLPYNIRGGEKYHYDTSIELTNVSSPACKVIAMIIDSQSGSVVNTSKFWMEIQCMTHVNW